MFLPGTAMDTGELIGGLTADTAGIGDIGDSARWTELAVGEIGDSSLKVGAEGSAKTNFCLSHYVYIRPNKKKLTS